MVGFHSTGLLRATIPRRPELRLILQPAKEERPPFYRPKAALSSVRTLG